MHQVIIIGGGPVGLSASICLAELGISSVLVEKHSLTTDHPKARGVNGRTMELFRSWGIENQVKQYQLPREDNVFTWVEDLQGKDSSSVSATEDYSPYSPTENAIISQDNVEQELFKKAQNMPLIDLRFNTEMVHAFQNEKQVVVEVRDKSHGETETLTAQYLIAADGAHSSLRHLFGIEMEGADELGSFCNIYCEMNLDKYVHHRPSASFMFTRPDIRGTFMLAKDGQRKWLVGVRLDGNPNLTKEMFTDDFCVNFVKKIVNDPEVEVRLINKEFWTMAALIANRYRVGNVFFAGDAAHQLPPTGGFGMNTGIQDAHNLAWKLAMVINNQAEESLLETYFTERVQIARTNISWSITNFKRFEKIFTALAHGDLPTFKEALADQAHHVNNILIDLGFIYGGEYINQEKYKPSAEVGARAPHCWLENNGEQISSLDLFKTHFVLMCHPESHYWLEKYRDWPCRIVTVGERGDYFDVNDDFLTTYGLSKTGAVLVRPDGHVAWRAYEENGHEAHFPWLRI